MAAKKAKSNDPLRDLPHYFGIFQTYIGLRMYVVFALTLFASAAEGVGILMLLPLLGSLDVGFSGMTDTRIGLIMQSFVDALGLSESLAGLLVVLFVFFLLKAGFIFGAEVYQAYLTAALNRDLKTRMLHGYNQMRLQHYNSQGTGHFINVINNQTEVLLRAFKDLMTLGAQIVNALIYLGFAVLVAWRFGLMAIAIGAPVLLAFRVLNTWAREISRRTSAEQSVLAKLLIQALQSFKYLNSTGSNQQLAGKAVASVRRLERLAVKMGLATAFSKAVQEPIIVGAVLLVVGFHLVWLGHPMGPIIVSIVLFNRGLNTMLQLQNTWLSVVGKLGAVEMVRDEFATLVQEKEDDGAQVILPLSQGIELQQVSFAYRGSDEVVIRDLSLSIPAKSTVAFVGESGASKSTLVDLITLMLPPSAGRVLIDGVSSEQINRASWREQIGFVSQETVVFDDTIANNICLWAGNADQQPELSAKIEAAAKQAHIHHFIESLPEGYQTPVGDRGVRLSGGQRQRLFIARELFKQPNLLILDEATSALDSESERAIKESIDELKGKMTVVIIAHRLSTIRNVDCVYVFDKGLLVEAGEYQMLRDSEGSRFGKLVAMQAL